MVNQTKPKVLARLIGRQARLNCKIRQNTTNINYLAKLYRQKQRIEHSIKRVQLSQKPSEDVYDGETSAYESEEDINVGKYYLTDDNEQLGRVGLPQITKENWLRSGKLYISKIMARQDFGEVKRYHVLCHGRIYGSNNRQYMYEYPGESFWISALTAKCADDQRTIAKFNAINDIAKTDGSFIPVFGGIEADDLNAHVYESVCISC